jgi:hypothetical protein
MAALGGCFQNRRQRGQGKNSICFGMNELPRK